MAVPVLLAGTLLFLRGRDLDILLHRRRDRPDAGCRCQKNTHPDRLARLASDGDHSLSVTGPIGFVGLIVPHIMRACSSVLPIAAC
jgi:ABC-type cobalamin transport system permease subunit